MAEEWGSVTRVVPDDNLSNNAAELALQLAAGATKALGAAKQLLHIGWTETLETQMKHKTQTITDIARTTDARRCLCFRGETLAGLQQRVTCVRLVSDP